MNHLQGLKRGDPVIYHRLGIDMHCEFLGFTRMSQHIVAVVWHEQDGKFLAPLSCIRISPKMERESNVNNVIPLRFLICTVLLLNSTVHAAPPCNYEKYVTVMVESGGLCQENVRRLGRDMWSGPVCQDMERSRVIALREGNQTWCAGVRLSHHLQRRVDWLNADLSDISGGGHVDMLR